jgi:hypothetical protein
VTLTATGPGGTDDEIKVDYIIVSDGGLVYPESTHPYSNNANSTWTFTLPGSPNTISVTFDPETSVENGYDYIHVMDGDGNPITGSPFTGTSLAGQTVVISGATVIIRLVSDSGYTKWGFRVVDVFEGGEIPYPESAHPYNNYANTVYRYTVPEVSDTSMISVTFDPETNVESGYDYIHVMDGDGNPITGSPFTGTSLAGQTVIVPGGTVELLLVSDGSVTRWGFRILDIQEYIP